MFAQDFTTKPAQCTEQTAAQEQLVKSLSDLQKQVAIQNQLLEQILNPPKQKHKKIVKVLLTIERVATDVGSAASISSVLGWAK